MAIVTEVTEGTPVSPTAATQYIALQDGYSMAPSFDVLENAELTGSIGKAKPVLGLENPTVELNHYIRHSGVEGQEPNFGKLIEGVLGDKSVNATEYDTVSGSTAGTSSVAAVVKVDAGEGVNFERGEALLIKDATNGYKIRNVLSVATDDLTLNFNLGNAPAAAVNLGKAVLYKPGSSYPTFSVWDYRGNGAATQLMAGSRVLSMGIEANAGEFVNGSFSLEGLSYNFNPIEITSSSRYIDFNDGGVNVATVATGFYDPISLAAALQTAMDAASADTITVTYSDSTGKFTIATSGATLSLLWNTGANTANTIGAKIGFNTAADDTAALTYTSDNAQTLSSPQTPGFDVADPLVAKAGEVMLGDFADTTGFCPSTVSVEVSGEKTDVLCVAASSGKKESVITGREVTVSLSADITQYDVDKFYRFKNNQTTAFMYNFGEKVGGNWVAGKCGNIYIPTCTITEFEVADDGGLVTLSMTLTAFVESAKGEFYINFV